MHIHWQTAMVGSMHTMYSVHYTLLITIRTCIYMYVLVYITVLNPFINIVNMCIVFTQYSVTALKNKSLFCLP